MATFCEHRDKQVSCTNAGVSVANWVNFSYSRKARNVEKFYSFLADKRQ
jgi:hypothetical protein